MWKITSVWGSWYVFVPQFLILANLRKRRARPDLNLGVPKLGLFLYKAAAVQFCEKLFEWSGRFLRFGDKKTDLNGTLSAVRKTFLNDKIFRATRRSVYQWF